MDDTEARRVLREHGEEPPERGKLNADWRMRATAYADGDAAGAGAAADGYDGGTTEADFSLLEEEPVPAVAAERRPRRVRQSRPALRDRLAGRQGKPKRKHPRVPVDRLVSRVWETLGGMAARVDVPLGRCLMMQAPVAGLVMEDVVKGTVMDRALQPIARAEDKAEKVLALAAPPMLVLALEASAGLPEPQREMRAALIKPMLIESFVLWQRVAGDRMEEVLARAQEEAPARQQAEELFALIFAPPPGGHATAEAQDVTA